MSISPIVIYRRLYASIQYRALNAIATDATLFW